MQTPNRYFPVEPHYVFPFLQHMPRAAQAFISVHWPVGNFADLHDRDTAIRDALDIELVSRTEMRRYFPDAEIEAEKLAGLTKSWIAIKRS